MSLLLYLCYTLVLSACTLLKLPSVQVAANIPLVCITSFVPAILDLYTESFVVVLTASLEKLSKEVHARQTWADGGVRDTFTSWMEVVKAITMHNKVRFRPEKKEQSDCDCLQTQHIQLPALKRLEAMQQPWEAKGE